MVFSVKDTAETIRTRPYRGKLLVSEVYIRGEINGSSTEAESGPPVRTVDDVGKCPQFTRRPDGESGGTGVGGIPGIIDGLAARQDRVVYMKNQTYREG